MGSEYRESAQTHGRDLVGVASTSELSVKFDVISLKENVVAKTKRVVVQGFELLEEHADLTDDAVLALAYLKRFGVAVLSLDDGAVDSMTASQLTKLAESEGYFHVYRDGPFLYVIQIDRTSRFVVPMSHN